MQVHPGVIPYRGTRGWDAYGFGGFGSPREHKGRNEKHLGIDFITIPGDRIVGPFTGIFTHSGPVYTWTGAFTSVHIRGTGEFYPYTVILYYVRPYAKLVPGYTVSQLEEIGEAQDVSGAWDERVKTLDEEWARDIVRTGGKMTNHIHFELRMPDGQRLNPAPYLMHMGSC